MAAFLAATALLTGASPFQPVSARTGNPELKSASTSALNGTVFRAAAPVGETLGDVLVAALQINGSGTITAPSGWTQIGVTSYGGNTTASYYLVAGAGEPSSYTWHVSSYSRGSIEILDYTGISASQPVNAWAGGSGNGAAVAPGVVTTTSTLSLILVTWDGGASNLIPTTPTGYTQRWFLNSGEWTYGADALSPAAAGTLPAVTVASNPADLFTAQQIALSMATAASPTTSTSRVKTTPAATASATLTPTSKPTSGPTPTMTPTPAPPPTPYTGPMQPMQVISRNVPAYATNPVYTASWGNDASYDTLYRGTPPTSLIYDLSGVPSAHRGRVVVAWYNEASHWYPPATGDVYYNVPRDYTIDGSGAAGGGQPPADADPSWATLAAISGNIFGDRQQALNFSGYNWLRMRVTAVNGSAGNTDAAFNLDVHDASAGTTDSWTFFGDSITQDDMEHAEPSNFAQQVNGVHPAYFPSQIDGGVGGWNAGSPLQIDPATGQTYWSEFLNATLSRYVSVDFGTNDANSGVSPDTFKSQMQSLVDAVEAAGKVPVLRLIPWGCTSGIQANGPILNEQIEALWAADPRIVHGPNFWTFFSQNRNLISGDCIHPSLPDGAHAYRQQYAQLMLATVYQGR